MSDWFDGAGNGHSVDVREVFDDLALSALLELIAGGALVSVGLTRDGGAIGFTVTVDGRWRREYFRSGDELVAWCAEAIPAVLRARGVEPASAVPAPRRRRSKTL